MLHPARLLFSISFLASSSISRIKRKALADFPLAPSHPDDGECVVYESLRPTLRSDVFTFTGYSQNAQRVLQKCVADLSIDSVEIVGVLGTLNCISLVKGGFDSHLLVLEPSSCWTAGSHPAPETADPANLAQYSIQQAC